MSGKTKYYAIKVGRDVTDKIVTSWEECEKLVIGYPSVYKSFKTEKEAKSYIKNTTEKQVEIQLMWNEIHRKNRLKEKLEKDLGFTVPMYIAEAITEKNNKNEIYLFINMGVVNNRISKKNAERLRKYIDLC